MDLDAIMRRRRARLTLRVTALIVTIAVIGLVARYFRGKDPASGDGPGTAPAVADTRDFGAWYDWTQGTGDLAQRHRALVMPPLLERLPNGPVLPRLAGDFKFGPEGVDVTLKDGVYWSDETELEVRHVQDGFDRAVQGIGRSGGVGHDPRLMALVLKAKLKPTGKRAFNLSLDRAAGEGGALTEDEAVDLLGSQYFLPIRKDLIDAAPADDSTPWTVTLGSYRPGFAPTASLKPGDTLHYIPNPTYYRGRLSSNSQLTVPR